MDEQMKDEQQERQKEELRRLRRLLKQMYKTAEHASLTGAFSEGTAEITGRYNLILQRLPALGVETSGLFTPLPEDASLDRVGVACKLLSGYIEEDEEENDRRRGPNVIIGNMHGMEDLEKLKDIGRIVRENIAEAFGGRRPEPPTPPAPPQPPPPPQPPYPDDAPTQTFR